MNSTERDQFLHDVEAGRLVPLHRSLTVSEKSFDDAERTITAYCSTLDRDRHGDTIQPTGMRNANYRNNPVILWAHNYKLPPIAKSLWERADARGVRMCMQFDSRDEAMEIYRLYREGYLNAFSIGFLPVSFERIFENNMLSGLNFTEWELLECSAVPVPANPKALQDAVAKGIIRSERIFTDVLEAAPASENVPTGMMGEEDLESHLTRAAALAEECELTADRLTTAAIRLRGIGSSESTPIRSMSSNSKPESAPYDPHSLIASVAEKELRRRKGKVF